MKAHGSLSTVLALQYAAVGFTAGLADAKADLAKAEATVEGLGSAAKKAV